MNRGDLPAAQLWQARRGNPTNTAVIASPDVSGRGNLMNTAVIASDLPARAWQAGAWQSLRFC